MNRTNVIEDFTLLPLPPWWQDPWIIGGALLALILLALLGVWLSRRLRQPAPPPPPAPPAVVPPDAFLARLAALRARQPRPAAYPLAIEVSEILRSYLEARYQFRILYQTTREFLQEAAARPELNPAQRQALARFLAICDDVKFAQAPASSTELDGLLDTAEQVIRQTAASTPPPSPAPQGAA
jgi:hypothetical protein